jgi:chemotaxis protein methyltransferase WspC
MHRIENLLRKEIGLDAASLGSSAIERAVRLRMKNLSLKGVGDYSRLLHSSRAELDELIEAVVVIETWFFRDRDPFSAFVELALEWLEQHPAGTLRVLSVPCSSGEEPYSLAITLLDAQVPPHHFVINAVDISTHALARAKQAVYGKNSFRGKELAFRARHFRQTKDGYALNPRVRQCVQFHRDNLLGDTFLAPWNSTLGVCAESGTGYSTGRAGHTAFDFIFCRNLLIYFDRVAQVRALEKLRDLLAPQGVLFVGPAELPLVTHNGFANAKLTMAFACRKAARAQAESRGSRVENRSQPSTLGSQLTKAPEPEPQRESAAHTALVAPSDLDAARRLADEGRLKEAAAICEERVHTRGPSAQAYYLLGLVRDASGDPQAIEYYRKALYLEPNHYETLLQMALLLEKIGDPAGARIFKRRAQRVQQEDLIES